MKYTLLVIVCWMTLAMSAQTTLEKSAEQNKLAPALQQLSQTNKLERFTLVVNDLSDFLKYLRTQKINAEVLQEYPPAKVVVLRTSAKTLWSQLLPYKGVLFVDGAERNPKEELSLSGLDLSLNKINLAHHLFPNINGFGLTASIKEDRFDAKDIDLAGRYVASPTAALYNSTHASIMATMLGGAGNSFYNGKGAAWGATLTSTNFSSLLPESNYKDLNISVQNHSYGVDIENYYGAEALAYDVSVVNDSTLLHVFSAGNEGNKMDENGYYKNLPNVANLTGNFKMAKNVLIVGSQLLTGDVPSLSSKGPAYDGRVKPELVALGQDGSSGAAAVTSGVALLVQQAYQEQTGALPSAAMVKAILINSADDVGPPGIDFQSGYGSLNAYRALQTVQKQHFLNGNMAPNQIQEFQISVPQGAHNLKVTLVWSDVPAAVNATTALVNDLDLELQKDGQIWLPWVLNAFPNLDSLSQLPIRKKDHLNNVEQITLEAPAAGTYTIYIKGYNIPKDVQKYAIVYQWDTNNNFQWSFPIQNTTIEATENQLIRWQSTFSDTNAILEYQLNGGAWQLLDADLSLRQGNFLWQAPDTFATAILRIRTDNQYFTSDTFFIGKPLKVNVGFNCDNEFLLFWDKVPSASGYQLYQLGEQYLELLTSQSDTFTLLQKEQYPVLWYAVAPIFPDGHVGLRSYATNYTQQGVNCYLRNFLAILNGDEAELKLSLGTTFGLKQITIEKESRGIFKSIQTFSSALSAGLQTFDTNLRPGINNYRARLELQNGAVIYSDPSQIFYAGDSGYYLFPNPVRASQSLYLLSKTFDNSEARVFDALGRLVETVPLNSGEQNIDTQNLSAGIYQVVVFQNQKPTRHFKLILVP